MTSLRRLCSHPPLVPATRLRPRLRRVGASVRRSEAESGVPRPKNRIVPSDTYRRPNKTEAWATASNLDDCREIGRIAAHGINPFEKFSLAVQHSAELRVVNKAVTAGVELADLRGARFATAFIGPLKHGRLRSPSSALGLVKWSRQTFLLVRRRLPVSAGSEGGRRGRSAS